MDVVRVHAAVARLSHRGWVRIPRRRIDGPLDAFLGDLCAQARADDLVIAYRIEGDHVLVIDCEH